MATAAATRDQRTRAGRRGGARRNHSKGEGSDAGDISPAGEQPQKLPLSVLFGEEPAAEVQEQAQDAGKDANGTSGPKATPAATRSILHLLPTPSRAAHHSVPTQETAMTKGPEPWSLPAAPTPAPVGSPGGSATAAAAASEKNGGYREWLQSRGQQAMQRSRTKGCAAPSPPTAPPSTAPAGILEALQIPAPPQAVPWNVPNAADPQMQQWYGATGMDMSQMMNGQQSPMAFNGYPQGPPTPASQPSSMSYFGCQQGSTTPVNDPTGSMSFFSCQSGAGTPVSAQQSPMAFNGCQQSVSDQHGQVSFFGCQQGPPTPISGGQQQAPMSFFGCQQGAATPTAEQQPATAFYQQPAPPAPPAAPAGQPQAQEELMATLQAMMPGAFALGRDSIAEQLQNAAANCCYED